METFDLLEKWRDGVKNDLVHLSEKGPWGEGFVIYCMGYVSMCGCL